MGSLRIFVRLLFFENAAAVNDGRPVRLGYSGGTF